MKSKYLVVTVDSDNEVNLYRFGKKKKAKKYIKQYLNSFGFVGLGPRKTISIMGVLMRETWACKETGQQIILFHPQVCMFI